MNELKFREVGTLLVGLVLVGLGALFLVGQFFQIRFWDLLWPLLVIVPGLLFFAGMVMGGKSAAPLAIPGSIVTMVGLILLYQNTFGHWESWAYAWALIFPTAIGLGLAINGLWSDQPATVSTGLRVAAIGGVIFLVALVFFELVINISGFRTGIIGGLIGPLLLIGLGVYLLVGRNILGPRSSIRALPGRAERDVPFDGTDVTGPEAEDRRPPVNPGADI